jgi:hypothetical protein
MTRASVTICAVIVALIDQPTTRRENRSTIACAEVEGFAWVRINRDRKGYYTEDNPYRVEKIATKRLVEALAVMRAKGIVKIIRVDHC